MRLLRETLSITILGLLSTLATVVLMGRYYRSNHPSMIAYAWETSTIKRLQNYSQRTAGEGTHNDIENADRDNEDFEYRLSEIPDRSLLENSNRTLIVLFTTIKHLAVRERIHNNTLANWGAMRPWVQPVLYLARGDEIWEPRAKMAGWDVRTAPKLTEGLPVVKEMYLDSIETYDAPFYSYSNAEVLFDESLRGTLLTVYHAYKQRFADDTGVLIVGRRTNINISRIDDVDNLQHIRQLRNAHKPFHGVAQEYFITTKHGFPWPLVPPFVVGRVGYDNWMVAKALAWDLALVDASATLTAIHQSAADGRKSGWKSQMKLMNYKIIGRFDYSTGNTGCCPWLTEYRGPAARSDVVFRQRKGLRKHCTNKKGSAVKTQKQKMEFIAALRGH